MLARALKDVSNGFYIDIGAHHPVVDSVSKAFYDRGWRGIHVEPTSEYAALLRTHRPDEIVVQAAVSDNHEAITFFEMHGLSTGDADIAEMHRTQGIDSGRTVVPCLTLDDVIAQAGEREVHWLKIDVEGMEHNVIRGWRSSRLPWIVVVESTIPNSPSENWEEWEPLLLEKGYQFVYFDGLNRFYVSPHQLALKTSFRASPNVFDGFALHGDSSAPFCRYVNDAHRDREQALRHDKEMLAANVSSLQAEISSQVHAKDDLARQSEDRQRQLETQLAALADSAQVEKTALGDSFAARENHLKAEIDGARNREIQFARESAERERSLSAQVATANEEKNLDKQALLRELLNVEQTHHQALQKLHDEHAERERTLVSGIVESKEQINLAKDALFRRLLDEKQALFDARERLHHEMADKIAVLTAAHRARERDLQDRARLAATEHDRLSLHWAERERMLRSELAERDHLNAETVKALNGELDQRTQRQHLAHRLRENELLTRIDDLNARKNSLLEKQVDWQRQLLKNCDSLNETNQVLAGKVGNLEQGIQAIAKDKQLLQQELGQLNALTAEIARMKASLSWRLTMPLRALAQVFHPADAPCKTYAVAPKASGFAADAMASNTTFAPNLGEPVAQREGLSATASPQTNPPAQTLDFGLSMKTIKHIDQLLEIDGAEFVKATYSALLNRPVDATGMAYYLGRLRAGHGKAKVIIQIAQSKEAGVIRADIPGLDHMIASQKRARHWLTGWFSRQSLLAMQVHRIEYLLAQMEHRTDARLTSIERNVEAIGNRLKSLQSVAQTVAAVAHHTDEQPVMTQPRANIVDGLTLPVTGTPAEIIAALEEQIAASREAASFDC